MDVICLKVNDYEKFAYSMRILKKSSPETILLYTLYPNI